MSLGLKLVPALKTMRECAQDALNAYIILQVDVVGCGYF
jgi:hypothetical protein